MRREVVQFYLLSPRRPGSPHMKEPRGRQPSGPPDRIAPGPCIHLCGKPFSFAFSCAYSVTVTL
jgi:hypothetical protein